jgi:hypothetical protein
MVKAKVARTDLSKYHVRYDVDTYKGAKVQRIHFLIFIIRWGEWFVSHHDRFGPGIHGTGSRKGVTVGLTIVMAERICTLYRESNQNLSVVQPVA